MKPLVLGIDCSTTACRAIAWDRDGCPEASGRAGVRLLQPAPNWYEQEAAQWWSAARQAVRQVTETVDPRRIEGACIAHQRETFVPVSAQGRPTRKAILWLDERSRGQVARLEREIGQETFHALTGKPLTTNPSITKIAWLDEHEPATLASAAKVLDAHAFLVHRLTGDFVTSLASADPTGLLDLRSGTWCPDLVEAAGLRLDQLPDLAAPGGVIGSVTEDAAAATGLPSGLPVISGAGDGQCAGLGANAVEGALASLNLGTAVVSGRRSETYAVSPAFRTLHAAAPDGYFLETVIQGGAFTISWFLEQFGPAGSAALSTGTFAKTMEDAAREVPPGALGLIVVPYWNHAMTPYWDATASGITIGWTGAHRPEHLYRAILEGIAFEQRLLGEGVAEATGEATNGYVALGGGSRSDLWCQILADVTGVPIIRSETVEATCLGAGILAAAALGWYGDTASAADAMTRTGETLWPSAQTALAYDPLYEDVYVHLYPTLQPLLHRLADIRDGIGPDVPAPPAE